MEGNEEARQGTLQLPGRTARHASHDGVGDAAFGRPRLRAPHASAFAVTKRKCTKGCGAGIAARFRPQAMAGTEYQVGETDGKGAAGGTGVPASRTGALDGGARTAPAGAEEPHPTRLPPVAHRH